ncbi:MAG TPA: PP2C family protein-serine/threonine phosphatase [Thermoanaerobaculia bacterium]|nr:PP2C family protein-serine/threonine phosphatase [Thermoanaerobaculia bacterium]
MKTPRHDSSFIVHRSSFIAKMSHVQMKRSLPYISAAAGVIAILAVLPFYRPAQPKGVRVTRGDAKSIADRAARGAGINLDRTWPTIIWSASPILRKELRDHPQRAAAWDDPVLGPRLNAYEISYYHRGKEKYPEAGVVRVGGRTGDVTGAMLRLRSEDTGENPTEQQLRPRADAFVQSRSFRGAPAPVFESARPTVLRGRTDWVFRYRVETRFPLKNVVPYLNVSFAGGRFAGWQLSEEYSDGRQFMGDAGGDFANMFVTFAAIFALLVVLLVIFLRKYHAGEVGVGAASALFIAMLVFSIAGSLMIRVSASDGMGMGPVDARTTSLAWVAFKFFFADIPFSLLVFLAWAVGESYARERWGERLAAFETILRRDAVNATVGRSMLHGALFAAPVAAAALVVGVIPILFGIAWPSASSGTVDILFLGGPLYPLLRACVDSLSVAIVLVLFLLAWTHRRRLLWAGIVAAIALAVIFTTTPPPIDPILMRALFGFGAIAVVIAVFLAYDLLAATIALFGGTLITLIAPLLSVADGKLASELTFVLAIPLFAILAFAVVALMTRREVLYRYEDLAPHVKRIIERERVKAEIDAANRIQAALLPLEPPSLAGISVASHYRAATEIGGDYFDFLPQPDGDVGIAFGDVSGHGLTSGIVMAMAKAALLVQVGYDSAPRAVLEVLNDIVMKTAPRRILMTFFFGMLDPRTQMLRFASAGHLDPYVYRAASGRLEALSSWGFPLGVRRRDPFREHIVEFVPGDRLVLYSDGLIEAIDDDGEPFGFDRFEKTIAVNGHLSADEMKKALLNTIRKFTRNRPPEDDQTLVVVAFEEPAAEVLARETVAELAVMVH